METRSLPRRRPQGIAARELALLLEYLLLEESAYEQWSSLCLEFAASEFSIDHYGFHYLEICDNPNGEELLTDIYSGVLRECGLSGSNEEDFLLREILDQAYF